MTKTRSILSIMLVLLFYMKVCANDEIEATATPTEIALQNSEFLATIQELMQPNEACFLPCYWGLVVGNSNLTDVQDFWIVHFGMSIETTQAEDNIIFASFYTNFIPNTAYTDFSIAMTLRDDTLWQIQVSTFNTSLWLEDDWLALQNVVLDLDGNSNYFIAVSRGRVVAILVDTEANIMIQKTYRLQVSGESLSPDNNEPLLLCPTTDNLLNSSLWILHKETTISIEEILGNPTIPNTDLKVYQPIEFMTNVNSSEFSEFIQGNVEDCMEMLSYSELLELGYDF